MFIVGFNVRLSACTEWPSAFLYGLPDGHLLHDCAQAHTIFRCCDTDKATSAQVPYPASACFLAQGGHPNVKLLRQLQEENGKSGASLKPSASEAQSQDALSG
ncbi:hypothetical protein V6L77_13195 [Pannonibacter sp. Pt2-lr]